MPIGLSLTSLQTQGKESKHFLCRSAPRGFSFRQMCRLYLAPSPQSKFKPLGRHIKHKVTTIRPRSRSKIISCLFHIKITPPLNPQPCLWTTHSYTICAYTSILRIREVQPNSVKKDIMGQLKWTGQVHLWGVVFWPWFKKISQRELQSLPSQLVVVASLQKSIRSWHQITETVALEAHQTHKGIAFHGNATPAD